MTARCGYWLVVVIGLLWLLARYVLNDKSKKISVSHAKHWQSEIRVHKNIRVIRKIRVQKNLVFKMMSVQDDEWFKMMSGSFVVSGFM